MRYEVNTGAYLKAGQKERWGRWFFLAVLISSHLSYFFSIVITPQGELLGLSSHIVLAVPLLIFAYGLLLETKRE